VVVVARVVADVGGVLVVVVVDAAVVELEAAVVGAAVVGEAELSLLQPATATRAASVHSIHRRRPGCDIAPPLDGLPGPPGSTSRCKFALDRLCT
jgi:hypothetical protein